MYIGRYMTACRAVTKRIRVTSYLMCLLDTNLLAYIVDCKLVIKNIFYFINQNTIATNGNISGKNITSYREIAFLFLPSN